MSEEKEKKEEKIDFPKNPTILRWRPDFHYRDDKLEKHELDNFKSTDDSITDKEAYRVTLASLRGELASGNGSMTTGNYSLKAGEKYDPRFDYSYLNRPDLTIVDLDNFIEKTKAELEDYDETLKLQVKDAIKQAETKRKEMVKAEKSKTETNEE